MHISSCFHAFYDVIRRRYWCQKCNDLALSVANKTSVRYQFTTSDLLLADLNSLIINDVLKDSVWPLIDVFSELRVQVQTYLRASTQLEAHLSRILPLAKFPSFATNSHDSWMREKVETRTAGSSF